MKIDYTYLHAALDKVEHTTTINAFYNQFHAIQSMLSFLHPEIPESYFSLRFAYGLQAEFQEFVLRFNPLTVMAAYHLAAIYEESIYLDYFPEDEIPLDHDNVDEEDKMVMVEDLSCEIVDAIPCKESGPVKEVAAVTPICDSAMVCVNQDIHAPTVQYSYIESSSIDQDVIETIFNESAVVTYYQDTRAFPVSPVDMLGDMVTSWTSTMTVDFASVEEFVDQVEVPIAWEFCIENNNSDTWIQKCSCYPSYTISESTNASKECSGVEEAVKSLEKEYAIQHTLPSHTYIICPGLNASELSYVVQRNPSIHLRSDARMLRCWSLRYGTDVLSDIYLYRVTLLVVLAAQAFDPGIISNSRKGLPILSLWNNLRVQMVCIWAFLTNGAQNLLHLQYKYGSRYSKKSGNTTMSIWLYGTERVILYGVRSGINGSHVFSWDNMVSAPVLTMLTTGFFYKVLDGNVLNDEYSSASVYVREVLTMLVSMKAVVNGNIGVVVFLLCRLATTKCDIHHDDLVPDKISEMFRENCSVFLFTSSREWLPGDFSTIHSINFKLNAGTFLWNIAWSDLPATRQYTHVLKDSAADGLPLVFQDHIAHGSVLDRKRKGKLLSVADSLKRFKVCGIPDCQVVGLDGVSGDTSIFRTVSIYIGFEAGAGLQGSATIKNLLWNPMDSIVDSSIIWGATISVTKFTLFVLVARMLQAETVVPLTSELSGRITGQSLLLNIRSGMKINKGAMNSYSDQRLCTPIYADKDLHPLLFGNIVVLFQPGLRQHKFHERDTHLGSFQYPLEQAMDSSIIQIYDPGIGGTSSCRGKGFYAKYFSVLFFGIYNYQELVGSAATQETPMSWRPAQSSPCYMVTYIVQQHGGFSVFRPLLFTIVFDPGVTTMLLHGVTWCYMVFDQSQWLQYRACSICPYQSSSMLSISLCYQSVYAGPVQSALISQALVVISQFGLQFLSFPIVIDTISQFGRYSLIIRHSYFNWEPGLFLGMLERSDSISHKLVQIDKYKFLSTVKQSGGVRKLQLEVAKIVSAFAKEVTQQLEISGTEQSHAEDVNVTQQEDIIDQVITNLESAHDVILVNYIQLSDVSCVNDRWVLDIVLTMHSVHYWEAHELPVRNFQHLTFTWESGTEYCEMVVSSLKYYTDMSSSAGNRVNGSCTLSISSSRRLSNVDHLHNLLAHNFQDSNLPLVGASDSVVFMGLIVCRSLTKIYRDYGLVSSYFLEYLPPSIFEDWVDIQGIQLFQLVRGYFAPNKYMDVHKSFLVGFDSLDIQGTNFANSKVHTCKVLLVVQSDQYSLVGKEDRLTQQGPTIQLHISQLLYFSVLFCVYDGTLLELIWRIAWLGSMESLILISHTLHSC